MIVNAIARVVVARWEGQLDPPQTAEPALAGIKAPVTPEADSFEDMPKG